MKAVWLYIWALKGSIAAFVGFEILNVLSLGMLGIALYSVTFSFLDLGFPPLDDWGPNGWPLLIAAGAAWPFSFLVAGPIVHAVKRRGWRPRHYRILYIAILWLGALISWAYCMSINPPA